MYPYTIVHQYSPQPYYYPYNEYPSSALSSPMSYTLPRNRYSSPSNYDDNENSYFSEYHRHHYSHRHNHQQDSHHQKHSRARNITR